MAFSMAHTPDLTIVLTLATTVNAMPSVAWTVIYMAPTLAIIVPLVDVVVAAAVNTGAPLRRRPRARAPPRLCRRPAPRRRGALRPGVGGARRALPGVLAARLAPALQPHGRGRARPGLRGAPALQPDPPPRAAAAARQALRRALLGSWGGAGAGAGPRRARVAAWAVVSSVCSSLHW